MLAQMIRMWETWAKACDIKIICSTSMRGDQTAFMHLHQQAGYSVRGSIAYKRLNTATFEVEQAVDLDRVIADSKFVVTPGTAPAQPTLIVTGSAARLDDYKS
jgi:hypothetical protein